MRFGERLRELRRAKGLTLRGLAARVQVGFTYLSKAENERLDFGDYPSDALIVKLAKVLNADADELLLLAQKIPPQIKRRVLERPDVFRKLAELDDAALDRLVADADRFPPSTGAGPQLKAKARPKRRDPRGSV